MFKLLAFAVLCLKLFTALKSRDLQQSKHDKRVVLCMLFPDFFLTGGN